MPDQSRAEETDLDQAARLVQEGEDLVLRPPVQDDGRLDQIIAELRSMLWCEPCQHGEYSLCERRQVTEKTNGAGQTHRQVVRSSCPMAGWHELVAEARTRG